MTRRTLILLLAAVLLTTACSGTMLSDTTKPTASGPATTEPPDDGQDPTASTTVEPGTTAPPATTAPATTTPPEVDPGAPPAEGSAGLGDPYFPGLGNGGYDVVSYDLDLVVDPDEGTLTGRATIEATATQNLSAFNLDLKGLDVGSASVNGSPAAVSRSGSELTLEPEQALPAGETFTAVVDYGGSPTTSNGGGFPAGWMNRSDGVFVIGQPDGGSTWFPGNDHPSDKATFSVTVVVPEPWVVAAAGRLVSEETEGGYRAYRWDIDEPTATYLATIVVGDLVRVDRDPAGDVAIRDYLPPDVAADAPEAFTRIPEMIAVLEEAFGPYPYDAYGHVVVTGFPGALEVPTLAIFGRSALAPFIVEDIVVHELAHMWFGDSVTPETWDDIWLNEGFATYAEWLWKEEAYGEAAYRAALASAYEAMSFSGGPPPGDPGAPRMFADTVYVRGGLTLAAIRESVGDEVFFTALRTYAGRFAHGNASTEDFVAVVAEVGGGDITPLVDAWLFDDHLPPLPGI
jgi:aminopeptidase N